MYTNLNSTQHSKYASSASTSNSVIQRTEGQSIADMPNNNIDADNTTTMTINIATNPTNLTPLATQKPSYADQARKQPAVKNKYAPGQYRSHQPTTANLELASKIFNSTQQPPTAEYKYLYFPSNKRLKPSVIRSRLTLLGVDNVRILDAHCPDWNQVCSSAS
ncbi:hypothetical protein [Parasitella parasitica]|uniref:Uncharacterized protein n=1 Tax=Parasitella parasitica TaxID=35722 RepID=A0A0B7MUL6_9FUNG|nr:hypothetical protein [Parasitella parasitica]